jgi:hypothetical protein
MSVRDENIAIGALRTTGSDRQTTLQRSIAKPRETQIVLEGEGRSWKLPSGGL